MRDFKYVGISFRIINRSIHEIKTNYKYDIIMFDETKRGWIRVCSCKTLEQGKELVHERFSMYL